MTQQRLPAAERKKQILRAAIRVFSRRGFHGATTKQIASEAGVAEALLYRYFESKHDLFVSSVRVTSDRILRALNQILDDHSDNPAQALDALLGFSQGLMKRNEELAKMIFIVIAELDDPKVRDVYLPYQEEILERVSNAVDQWKKKGLLGPALPARASAWLILGSFQLVALMKHAGRLDELDAARDSGLVARFLASVAAPNAAE